MLVLGCVFLGGVICRAGAEDLAKPVTKVEGAPEMKGAVYRFFDEQTGTLFGELRIGAIGMEYRKQGFMRVAWRPLVVLSEVDLDMGANTTWPAQGSQILRALEVLGGRDELILREVRLHLAGTPDRNLSAGVGRLLPGGVLELSEAAFTGESDAATPLVQRTGVFRLVLSGPQAGRFRQSSQTFRPQSRALLSANNSPVQSDP